ncbi:MAG: hypothetical protein V1821_02920, partial [bacterium]
AEPGYSAHEKGLAVDIAIKKMNYEQYKRLVTVMESNNFIVLGDSSYHAKNVPKGFQTISEAWHFTYQMKENVPIPTCKSDQQIIEESKYIPMGAK